MLRHFSILSGAYLHDAFKGSGEIVQVVEAGTHGDFCQTFRSTFQQDGGFLDAYTIDIIGDGLTGGTFEKLAEIVLAQKQHVSQLGGGYLLCIVD